MTKSEFLTALACELSGLPNEEIAARVAFFDEMIADRIEEGMEEADAVAAMGTPKEVAAQIVAEFPLAKLVKARVCAHRRLSTGEIALLAVGAPLWLSLLLALFGALLSVYASLWACVLSLWVTAAAAVSSGVGMVLAAVPMLFMRRVATALLLLGVGLMALGASILCAVAAKLAGKGLWWLTQQCVKGLKYCCLGRGEAK